MDLIETLVGDWRGVWSAALKAGVLFVVVAMFRFDRRTLAELSPFDFAVAVAVGAIIGRTATSASTSLLTGVVALLTLLTAHAAVTRLRYHPVAARLIDPKPKVIVRDGEVQHQTLRRCGLTPGDLSGVLRQHGYTDVSQVGLAVYERKGAVSVLSRANHADEPSGDRDGRS